MTILSEIVYEFKYLLPGKPVPDSISHLPHLSSVIFTPGLSGMSANVYPGPGTIGI